MSTKKLGISSANPNRRYTGVGVLIVTNYNNKPHFVLGREAYKSIKINDNYCVSVYEEFGGGIQKPSQGLEANACFELKEESSNLLNFTDPEILKKGVNRYFDIPFKEDRIYRIYVIYIENAESLFSLFTYNRDVLLSQSNNYYKYKHYLEMDALKLIPIDSIKQTISNKNNYICIYPEDTLYNENPESSTFVGLLRLYEDTYISKRLSQFLNTDYDGKTGLDWCLNVFYDGFINMKYMPHDIVKKNIITLTEPICHPAGSNKLKFLDGTYSLDGI